MKKLTEEEKKIRKQIANKAYKEKNREKISQQGKEYYQNKKDEIKAKYETNKENNLKYAEQYRKENKEKILLKQREWREKNKDKYLNDKKVHDKKYRENNKEKFNKKNREKRKNDNVFKIKENIRSSINKALRNKNFSKPTTTEIILGCSFKEFKLHLESKFESWMNWDNYGLYNGELNYGWDIDHIIPLHTAKTESELIKLNHFSNLRPLCSYMNRVVRNKKGG